ncbi:hypothetical protein ACQB60_15380 [Actinomycetota bacterium Odt1-20B]
MMTQTQSVWSAGVKRIVVALIAGLALLAAAQLTLHTSSGENEDWGAPTTAGAPPNEDWGSPNPLNEDWGTPSPNNEDWG